MNRSWIVYRIKNKKNNRSYIGITKRGLKTRIQCHKNSARKGSDYVIHKAIRKHGWDSFKTSILVKNINSLSEANRLEVIMIKLFNSNKKGYNMTVGGDGASFPEDYIHPNKGKKWSKDTRKKIIAIKKHSNFRHSESTKKSMSERRKGGKNPRAREVWCINVESKEIEFRFGSVCEAARAFECNHTTISKAARELKESGERRVALGYYWGYSDDENLENTLRPTEEFLEKHRLNVYNERSGKNNHASKRIASIDPFTGKVIEIFESVGIASKKHNCTHSILSVAARKLTKSGERRTAKGYYWSYLD